MAFKPKDNQKHRVTLVLPKILVDDATGEEIDMAADLDDGLAKRALANQGPQSKKVSDLTPAELKETARKMAMSVIFNAYMEGKRLGREERLQSITQALVPLATVEDEPIVP